MFEPSNHRLVWPNGAIAELFSAEDPDSLRGPQFHVAWCDEVAKWRLAETAFDMLQFGLRLGSEPRQVVTTTPRPVPILKRLINDAATVVTRSRTKDNATIWPPPLSPRWNVVTVELRLADRNLMVKSSRMFPAHSGNVTGSHPPASNVNPN